MKADAAYLHVDYTVLPFAGTDRKKAGRTDKRMQEICLALQQTLSQATILKLYPRTQIDVRLQVVQQDGGALACAINAATLALIDAGIPLYHFIAACAVGSAVSASFTGGGSSSATASGTPQALLDVTALEEADVPWLTLATEGKSDKISFLQCETRLGLDAFDACLEFGVLGCQAIQGLLEGVCREAGKEYKAKLNR
jgi:exosome complex component RRP41